MNDRDVVCVFIDGLLLVGELEITGRGKKLLHNPLNIIRTAENEAMLSFFGLGYIQSPIELSDSVTIGIASKFGKQQYKHAMNELTKNVEKDSSLN